MGGSKLLIAILTVGLLGPLYLNAQEHRFMVFFKDKNSTFSIGNPAEYLSLKAIDRRSKQNIAITEQDLPVNQAHILSLEGEGAKVMFTTKWLNGALVQADSSIVSDISDLSVVSSIEFVAPGPLTPQIGKELHKKNKGTKEGRVQSTEIQNKMLGVDLMQQDGITGEGMLVAVFDGGFLGVDQNLAFDHLKGNNQLIATFDFVGNSSNVYRYADHGTKVLSVMAANNPGVYTGSVVDSDFILCITEDVTSEYRIEEYNWLFAAEMADSAGVDIINTSLGYNNFDDSRMNYQIQDLDGTTPVISNAASIAATKGMVLTASAGNDGSSVWRTITAPADAIDIIAVGAINSDTIKASFSSTGPTADGRVKPDVVALGVNTAVVNQNGNVVFNNGTSFSAPQIAGLAAGVWQSNPDYDYLEVIQSIRNSGHETESPNNQTGHGIPNYLGTKKLVLSIDEAADTSIKLYPNPLGDQLYMFSDLPLPIATFFVHNISGQKMVETQLVNIPATTEVPISLPPLRSGVYLITVISPDYARTLRLIKE